MAGDFLLYFALKYDGDYEKMFKAVEDKEQYTAKEYNEVVKQKRYKHINCLNEAYPFYLRLEDNPPIVLFYQGNLELLEVEGINIKLMTSNENKRTIAACCPDFTEDGRFVLDYIIASETQDDLDYFINRLKEAELPLRNYDRTKSKEIVH